MCAQRRPAFGAAAFFASSRPPSTLRLRHEEEENEECRRDTSGELIAAQDGGDSRRRRTTELDSRVRVRVSGAEENGEGREREKQRGGFTYRSRGRGHSEEEQGRSTRRRPGYGASPGHCGAREEANFVITPPPPKSFEEFTKRSRGRFRDLNRAPGHFYKMCKNSYGRQLTFRCSTKIGEAN